MVSVKRLSIACCAVLLLLLAAFGLLWLAEGYYYYPGGPSADYPEPANRLEAMQQDLDYFRHYLELDRSYTHETRARAGDIVNQLQAQLAELSDAAFHLGIARAVATADNGHSNIWMARFSRLHGRLPLRFYWFSDGPAVVRARADLADLLGARLIAIGDTPLAEAATALAQFVGGTREAFTAYRGPVLLELPSAHAAAGLSGSESSTRLTLRLADGRREVRRIEAEALTGDDPLYWSHTYLTPSPPLDERSPWVSLASRLGHTPLYLAEPEKPFRMAGLPEGGLYVQFRDNYSDGIGQFADAVRARVTAMVPGYIVLDERFNGGGDYTKTASLMFDLPGMVAANGPLYILTGPATFSAAINSVAFAKSAGGDRVIVVGQRVGDRERIYGETNDFELPNSGLGMTFSTGLHDVGNGCPPFPQCYYKNYFYNVAVGKLDPDLQVETRLADYLAGTDPVLDAVLARQLESAPRGEPAAGATQR